MTLRKVIKKNAKTSLKGNWGKAILILLIFIGVNLVLNLLDSAIFKALGYENMRISYNLLNSPSFQFDLRATENIPWGAMAVSFSFSLIRLCLIAPLTLGILNWALELTDGRVKPVGSIFWAYDNTAFGRSIWMEITIAVKVTLFAWLVMLIPALLVGFGDGLSTAGVISDAIGTMMVLVGSLLTLACIPLVLWFSARYYIARLLLCDRYYYTVGEATRLSVRATKGRRWEIVGFILSYLPWFLLCCFVVPILYVLPYYRVASAMYARFMFEDHLMRENKLNLTDPDRLIVDDLTPEAYQEARAEQGIEQAVEPVNNASEASPEEGAAPSPLADAENTVSNQNDTKE